jgi:hypothetical protein
MIRFIFRRNKGFIHSSWAGSGALQGRKEIHSFLMGRIRCITRQKRDSFLPHGQAPVHFQKKNAICICETATMPETNLIIKAALRGGKGEAPAELHAEPVNHCIGLSCSDNSIKQNFN